MCGLGGGRTGVGDHEDPVAEVGAGSRGAFHREVGGDAGEDHGVYVGASQDGVEFGAVEAADPVMGQHDIAVARRELVDDGCVRAAVDEAPVLGDVGEQRDVGHQFGVAGLEGGPWSRRL